MSFNQPNRDSPGSLHDVVSNTDGPSIDRISNDHKYDSGDVEGLHLEKKVTITDPVFGEILEDGPQYRNVHLPPAELREADQLSMSLTLRRWDGLVRQY